MPGYDDYERRRMMGYNPFDSRYREPDIVIYEPAEGRIGVEVRDMNNGMRYRKEFILEYNHNKGRRAFGGGIMDAAKSTLSKSAVDKLLMLFL